MKDKKEIAKIFSNVSFYLGIIYCLLPFFYSLMNLYDNNSASNFRYMFMAIIGSIALFSFIIYIIFLKRNCKLTFKNILPLILLISFLIWSFISSCLSNNKSISFLGTDYRKEGFLTYLFYGGFIGIGAMINDKNKYKILANIILITAIYGGAINLLGNEISLKLFATNPYAGFFHHFNHFAYFLNICIFIAILLMLDAKKILFKLYYFIVYIFLLFILIINNTFGVYLAILFSIIILIIYLIKNKLYKYAIIIFLPFLILSCILKSDNYQYNKTIVFDNFVDLGYDLKILTNNSKNTENNINSEIVNIDSVGSDRGGLWRNGLNFIKQKPLFGYGPDNLESEYNKLNIDMDRAHNLIIQLAATTGIIGCLFYFSSLFVILIYNFKRNKFTLAISLIIVSYLISSMFGNSMYTISPYFMLLFGVLIGINLRCDGDNYV